MSRHARPQRGAARGAVVAAVSVVVVGLLGAGGALLASSGALDPTTSATADESPRAPSAGGGTTTTPTPTPPPDAELTIVAAGDVLLHQPVLTSARSGDGWDFTPLLEPIQPWVEGADLALCHLEVPVAPAGARPSGYPVFGAPASIADGLAATGWDGCSTASNHSVDRGWDGLVATLDALDAAGLGHVGTARTAEEAAAPQVYELVRGEQTIRIAHVAATYGTNGLPVPSDAPWSVTLLDTDAVVAQARQARADGADAVVASVHCCVEYVSEPTEEQDRIATELAESGEVDLVIGHHAHVPQTVERLPGGPQGDGMWVAHGLGNMISNQDRDCCSPRTDSGLLLFAELRKPADGPVEVTGVQWAPITVDRGAGHQVLALADVLAVGADLSGGDPPDVRHARVVEVAGDDAPERTSPPEPTGPEPDVVPRAQTSSTGTD